MTIFISDLGGQALQWSLTLSVTGKVKVKVNLTEFNIKLLTDFLCPGF
jgi:hypothetical protein